MPDTMPSDTAVYEALLKQAVINDFMRELASIPSENGAAAAITTGRAYNYKKAPFQLHFRFGVYHALKYQLQVESMKILMVEDERDLADAVTVVLQKNNFAVDNAYDGEYGLDCALTGIYDIIVLDIMLPKMDGLRVLRELRAADVPTPVLMLTAKGELRDRVAGLDCGADDYLPKPFHIDELLARLRALGRRKGELHVDGVIQLGPLQFNPQTLSLLHNKREISLTLKESQLLEVLAARKGGYVSKDTIIEKVWSYDADVQDSHVESQVSLLRKKLAAAGGGLTVKASRGVGYRLEEK